jgi:hypothetical protein
MHLREMGLKEQSLFIAWLAAVKPASYMTVMQAAAHVTICGDDADDVTGSTITFRAAMKYFSIRNSLFLRFCCT